MRSTLRAPCPSASRSRPPSASSSTPADEALTPWRNSSESSPSLHSRWFPPAPSKRQNEAMVETDRDPRIERSRRVILEAALEELGQAGYGALTIESVAARAGVGKSTIYRHWPGKLALVEDAFRTLKAQTLVLVPGTF